MARKNENQGFVCANCGLKVLPLTNGSYRNHCPQCLHSLHVDQVPGDRASDCGGLMRPVGLKYCGAKGYQIVHRCVVCGAVRANEVAECTTQPDSIDALIGICSTMIL